MEAVHRGAAACPVHPFYGRSKELVGERMLAVSPRAKEIILRSRPVNRGRLLSIDKEHVFAFAKPIVLILKDGHGDSDKMALPLRLYPCVIVLTIEVWLVIDRGIAIALPVIRPALCGCCLTILGVEIHRVLRKRLIAALIVNIEIKRVDLLCAFIRNSDTCMLLERHGEERVQG